MFAARVRATVVVAILAASALAASPLTTAGALASEARPPLPVDDGIRVPLPPGADTPDLTGAAPVAAAPSAHKVYVYVVSATSSASDDLPAAQFTDAAIKAHVKGINDYWSPESSGTITTTLGGIEREPKNLKQDPCYMYDIVDYATAHAFGGAFANNSWLGTNKHLLILSKEGWQPSSTTDTSQCGRAYGTIGSPGYGGGWMFMPKGATAAALPTTLHEYGHNLGMTHANSAICQNTASMDGPLSAFKNEYSTPTPACPTVEYGDYLDVMGQSSTDVAVHVSAPQRIQLGMLPSSSVTTITNAKDSTTVTLKSLDATSGIRVARIKDPRSGGYYFVEYRTAQGIDALSPEFDAQYKWCEWIHNGYQSCAQDTSSSEGAVRILREFSGVDGMGTAVLATGAISSDKKQRHTRMNIGDRFTNWGEGFRLKLNSASPSAGANITVSYYDASSSSALVLSSPASQVYGGAQRVTATAQVAKIGATTPPGTFYFRADGKTIGSKAVNSSGAAAMNLPTSLAGGTRSITAVFDATSPWIKNSTSATQRLTVTKASSTASITLKASSVKKKKKLGATIVIKAPGVSGPSGTVSVYSGSKKLKTYSLSSSRKGKLAVTLPKFKKKGKFQITVKYSGNSSITSSVSVKKSLKVK